MQVGTRTRPRGLPPPLRIASWSMPPFDVELIAVYIKRNPVRMFTLLPRQAMRGR